MVVAQRAGPDALARSTARTIWFLVPAPAIEEHEHLTVSDRFGSGTGSDLPRPTSVRHPV